MTKCDLCGTEEQVSKAKQDILDRKSAAMRGHGIVDKNHITAQAVQEELMELKLLDSVREIDGKFGRRTQEAVKTFQRSYNTANQLTPEVVGYLKDDGVVGKDTLQAMAKTRNKASESTHQVSTTKVATTKDPAANDSATSSTNNTPPQNAKVEDTSTKANPPSDDSTTVRAQAIEAAVEEARQGLAKGNKAAFNAEREDRRTMAMLNEDREKRPLTDKFFGMLHNDAKEHNLRLESAEHARSAQATRLQTIESAWMNLEGSVTKAADLRNLGKETEAQALLSEAAASAKIAYEQKPDLTKSRVAAKAATAAAEQTAAQAEIGVQVLTGVETASAVVGTLTGAAGLARLAFRGLVKASTSLAVRQAPEAPGRLFNATKGSSGVWVTEGDVVTHNVSAAVRHGVAAANPTATSNVSSPASPAPVSSAQAEPTPVDLSKIKIPDSARPQIEHGRLEGRQFRLEPTNIQESVRAIGDNKFQYQAEYDVKRVRLGPDGKDVSSKVVGRNKHVSEFTSK